jgi:hypothetical protein
MMKLTKQVKEKMVSFCYLLYSNLRKASCIHFINSTESTAQESSSLQMIGWEHVNM